MDDLLAAIDRLCPCGAEKAEGAAYCSDDCRPTHIGEDTDPTEYGPYATPARWRPDLDDLPDWERELLVEGVSGELHSAGTWMATQRPVAAGQLLYADDVRPIGPRVTSASVTVHLDDGSTVTYDLHEGGELEFEAAHEREPDEEIDPFVASEPVRFFGTPSRYRLEVRGRYSSGADRHITLTHREAPPAHRHPGGVVPEP